MTAALARLHCGEEFLRTKSLSVIAESLELSAHVRMIEATMGLLDHFARQYQHKNQDELTIQLLGIRLFNGAASAFKLMLSGYYQNSAVLERDILEISFLLSYFSIDRSLIALWRTSDRKIRREKFAPAVVRMTLDARDGFTERKREKAYQLLSELAGHATYKGFAMLIPAPGLNAHCGPFFGVAALKAVLEELAKHLLQAGVIFSPFFEERRRADFEIKISFIEEQGSWLERFFGQSFDRTGTEELRALLAQFGSSK
jgi:hypothetical protein